MVLPGARPIVTVSIRGTRVPSFRTSSIGVSCGRRSAPQLPQSTAERAICRRQFGQSTSTSVQRDELPGRVLRGELAERRLRTGVLRIDADNRAEACATVVGLDGGELTSVRPPGDLAGPD